MQIFAIRYNLKFRKLTLYGLTRPQSIRKSRQISEQTILSSPQGLEFNPKFASLRGRRKKGRGRGEGEGGGRKGNFAKSRDIPVVKNSIIWSVTAVLPIVRFMHLSMLCRWGRGGGGEAGPEVGISLSLLAHW